MSQADWYFDFISPYAYLGLMRLRELPQDLEIRYRPVLFAGLLNHWEQKGPAEIAPKRSWTYRSCTWWASAHGIPFRFPAAHPFNSLPYLRLAIAAGSTGHAGAPDFRGPVDDALPTLPIPRCWPNWRVRWTWIRRPGHTSRSRMRCGAARSRPLPQAFSVCRHCVSVTNCSGGRTPPISSRLILLIPGFWAQPRCGGWRPCRSALRGYRSEPLPTRPTL
jgi:hypothetical protein